MDKKQRKDFLEACNLTKRQPYQYSAAHKIIQQVQLSFKT